MLPEDYEKYQIIPTRAIMYIVVKISNRKETFKKLIDLCKYGNLVISNRKKQTEVCMLLDKIKIWQTSNGYYQIYEKRNNLRFGFIKFKLSYLMQET